MIGGWLVEVEGKSESWELLSLGSPGTGETQVGLGAVYLDS